MCIRDRRSTIEPGYSVEEERKHFLQMRSFFGRFGTHNTSIKLNANHYDVEDYRSLPIIYKILETQCPQLVHFHLYGLRSKAEDNPAGHRHRTANERPYNPPVFKKPLGLKSINLDACLLYTS